MTEWEESFAEWLTETVTVRRYLGPGAQGPVYSAPVTVGPEEGKSGVMLNYGERMVRGTTEETRLSDARIVCGLGWADSFPVESLVTLPDGRERTVLQRNIDPPQVPLPHVRVVLV